jgi:hypothetical protein
MRSSQCTQGRLVDLCANATGNFEVAAKHFETCNARACYSLVLAPCIPTGRRPNEKSDRYCGPGARICRGDDRRPRASCCDCAGRPASSGRRGRERRQGSVRLSRQALLLVPGRMAGTRLVPVRFSLAPWPRLGRSCRMARLARTGPARPAGHSSARSAGKAGSPSAGHPSADR